MALTVLSTRSLPLPALSVNGQPILIVPPGEPGGDDAVAMLATALDTVSADMIAALPDTVGLIANFGVGVDNIDLGAARARGIRVSNTPVVAEDTADLAFALMLGAARRLAAADRFVRAGDWAEGRAFPIGTRVHGARLGLIGFGAIAQAVARRAQGFGMDVRYWARSEKPEGKALNARFVPSLTDLVADADIVSLHVALTPETTHIVNAELLARVTPGIVLINTGRGGLIDEGALVSAIKSGQVGTAGLDVFDAEPRVNPALLELDQVVLTPHIGAATGPCRTDQAARAIANLIGFLENGTVLDPVA